MDGCLLLTVFQSYQDDGRAVIEVCVRRNPFTIELSWLKPGFEPGTTRVRHSLYFMFHILFRRRSYQQLYQASEDNLIEVNELKKYVVHKQNMSSV